MRVSVLPQWFADRLGWTDLASQTKTIVESLSAEDRQRLGILCDNYGEASATNFYDRREAMPFAMSGHNTFFVWGTRGYHGDEFLLVTSQTLQELNTTYRSVRVVGSMHSEFALPGEQKTIYLARGRVRPLFADWDSYRWFY